MTGEVRRLCLLIMTNVNTSFKFREVTAINFEDYFTGVDEFTKNHTLATLEPIFEEKSLIVDKYRHQWIISNCRIEEAA